MSTDVRQEARGLIEAVLARPGWTKVKLAAALGVDPTTLWRARKEAGANALRSETLERLRSIAAGAVSAAEAPGDRLRAARRKAGLSTGALAKALGLSESAVRNQENGTNGMKVESAGRYASILGVTPDWLLFGTGDIAARTDGGRSPVKMTSLGDGSARLEMNMIVPMGVALQVLALVHTEDA